MPDFYLVMVPEGVHADHGDLEHFVTKYLHTQATVTEVVRSEFPSTDIPYWTEGKSDRDTRRKSRS